MTEKFRQIKENFMVFASGISPEMKNNARSLILSLIISSLLFLFLPVSYYLFHQEIYRMMKEKKMNIIPVETVQIKEKERKIEKIEKKQKTEVKKLQQRFINRFNLDLSVLGADSDAAGLAASGFGNVIEEGEADIPPIKKVFIPPRYPQNAREEGIEGVVVAKLLIDEKGNVVTVRIIKEPRHWGFGQAVTEAAGKWRFEPAKLNSIPVKVWATQVIEFKL